MSQSGSLLVSKSLTLKPGRPGSVRALIRPINASFIPSFAGIRFPTFSLASQKFQPISARQLSASSSSPIYLGRGLGYRPTPELGLLSVVFVLSMAVGAVFSLAIISIPTMASFGRLATSIDKLEKVISEEVPGTLSSLKLSGLEINDLTQQFSNIRQKIYGNQSGKKHKRAKPNSSRRKN